MRRLCAPALGLLVVLGACFGGVLVRGEQFGFRDAAHHYYPLYLRVQQEWSAGRVPLWDPWQNGGTPLLGNPTAAVFYPGKLIYAALPYPWAVRLYVVAHVVLAFAAMAAVLRGWGASTTGATLGGLAYAFGGPVLLLCSNVIYLVGAAWMPLGLWAADRWLRLGRRSGLVVLPAVAAVQVLGSDPEAAYLTLMLAAGYAVVLRSRGSDRARGPLPWVLRAGWVALAVLGWLAASVTLTAIVPGLRAWIGGVPFGSAIARGLVLLGWALLVWTWVRRAPSRRRGLVGLAVVGMVALAVSGIQVVPTAEFVAGSTRGGGVGFDRYGFSLVPYRVAELVWPSFFGSSLPENRLWRSALPPTGDATAWVPSLYLGALTLVLAIAGFRARRETPGARLMAWVVPIAVIGSFGLYAGPLGLGRWLPWVEGWLPWTEPPQPTTAQADFRAGDGSPYWLLAALLPGLDLFRYPSKLLVPMALGLSALAGLGWDLQLRRPSAAVRRIALGLAVLSLVALLGVTIGRGPILAWWDGADRASPQSGPLQVEAAYRDLQGTLMHGAIAFGLVFALLRIIPRSPRLAEAGAVALLAVDLAVAQPGLIWTVPQAVFETPPRAWAAIQEAESNEANGGPFRVHRPPAWYPFGWFRRGSHDRLSEIVAWERDTLQPLYGLPLDASYTLTLGVLESQGYLRNFLPARRPVGPELAGVLGMAPSDPALLFPRRAFDLWNTRYFILPVDGAGWLDESRGYAAFLERVEIVTPPAAVRDDPAQAARWRLDEDWQVFRNRAAFPRAWVVHEARVIPPLDRLDERDRPARIRAILDSSLGSPAADLRRIAWIEAEEPRRLRLDLDAVAEDAEESVRVAVHEPQRVELEADLRGAGLVVLADADAPGWTLRIDGQAAPIHRANLGMRAARVPAGRHRLVYRYEPTSVRLGAALSLAGLLTLAGLAAWSRRTRRDREPGSRPSGEAHQGMC
jgi:hypothetical protein